jgi:elongation factor Ts
VLEAIRALFNIEIEQMNITADLVKQLRDETGVGMMECKKALVEANGDKELAIELMRKSGMAKAAKKGDRTAAEGVVMLKITDNANKAIITEINCETDFVAKDANFLTFANKVLAHELLANTNSISDLMAQKEGSETLEEQRLQLIAKIGEKVDVRRFDIMNTKGIIGGYVHGGRIGVLVDVVGGNTELAKDLAMHIAASKPQYIFREEVPAEVIAKEKEILFAQAEESGKPANIIEKVIGGQINKFLDDICLMGQAFVKDPDMKISDLLKKHDAKVNAYICYILGEGIEKKVVNFREEVMAQVKGA